MFTTYFIYPTFFLSNKPVKTIAVFVRQTSRQVLLINPARQVIDRTANSGGDKPNTSV